MMDQLIAQVQKRMSDLYTIVEDQTAPDGARMEAFREFANGTLLLAAVFKPSKWALGRWRTNLHNSSKTGESKLGEVIENTLVAIDQVKGYYSEPPDEFQESKI